VILPRDQVRRVLGGRKTEARRPTTYAELKPPKVVPVQVSVRDEAACRVRIVSCEVELLGDITPEAAWREGFKRKDDFFAWFEARFGSAEREREVYVLRFALVNFDPPRFLAKQDGLRPDGTPHQYTSSVAGGLPGEPEAVPKADQDLFSREAGQVQVAAASLRAQARRERWSLSQRLQRLETSVGTDHSSHLRVIEKRIEAMERGEAA
jgi:hypothetical protein